MPYSLLDHLPQLPATHWRKFRDHDRFRFYHYIDNREDLTGTALDILGVPGIPPETLLWAVTRRGVLPPGVAQALTVILSNYEHPLGRGGEMMNQIFPPEARDAMWSFARGRMGAAEHRNQLGMINATQPSEGLWFVCRFLCATSGMSWNMKAAQLVNVLKVALRLDLKYFTPEVAREVMEAHATRPAQ
jgi:hypothetical protein